ncbi:hypothetical protein HWV07_11530 [Natronomonas salina]|uniref:hypothetical protein n=1 Tax=Natronomonas salina TaxID=1710540 RepID=UPI0015B607F2|nr:hypothetical protein [Natronomonas salina]QLD89624.1 hypothetical protein HWV07_11530 [Natronomonas salina]
MTDVASPEPIADGGDLGPTSSCGRTVARWLCPDGYCPIDETARSADIRSPLKREYSLSAVLYLVLGRESATCEACQSTVHVSINGDLGEGNPFVIRNLVENVYTVENKVLLCVSCVNRPTAEWRADVRAKRAQERDQPPTCRELLAYWLSDPTATSLFARRVAACLVGLLVTIVLFVVLAGVVGTLHGDIASGGRWASVVLTETASVWRALLSQPWLVGGVIGLAYTVHHVERGRYDPRGYRRRDQRPWITLAAAGATAAVGALCILGLETGLLPASLPVAIIAGAVWLLGAAGVAWFIDLAIRHDLAISSGSPRGLPGYSRPGSVSSWGYSQSLSESPVLGCLLAP